MTDQRGLPDEDIVPERPASVAFRRRALEAPHAAVAGPPETQARTVS
jgi:hypothetical protein